MEEYIFNGADMRRLIYEHMFNWINRRLKEMIITSGYRYYGYINLDCGLDVHKFYDFESVKIERVRDAAMVVIKYRNPKKFDYCLRVPFYNEPTRFDLYVEAGRNSRKQ